MSSFDDWQKGYEEWKKALLEAASLETPPDPHKTVCYVHRPAKYVGFTETYEYCEICDAKLKDGKWQK